MSATPADPTCLEGTRAQMNERASGLPAAQLEELRAQAARTAGSLVDPRLMRKIEQWWNFDLCEWAAVVVGHLVGQLGQLAWWKWVLLDLAHDAEPAPPPP